MLKLSFALVALAAGTLAGCQPASSPAAETTATTPAPTAAADAAAPTTASPVTTEAAARAAVARHIQALPNATLFVPDSALVNDNNMSWQVLVPRTDWVGRMPNRARFEVNKQTGQVSSQPVK